MAREGMVVGVKLVHGGMVWRHLGEETIPLQPGDHYPLLTDGISEARNGQDSLFGESRLGRLVESHANLPSEELRERVLREIAAFVGDAPPLLQHPDPVALLGQPQRRDAATEPGSDHHHVVVDH